LLVPDFVAIIGIAMIYDGVAGLFNPSMARAVTGGVLLVLFIIGGIRK